MSPLCAEGSVHLITAEQKVTGKAKAAHTDLFPSLDRHSFVFLRNWGVSNKLLAVKSCTVFLDAYNPLTIDKRVEAAVFLRNDWLLSDGFTLFAVPAGIRLNLESSKILLWPKFDNHRIET